MTSGRGKQRLDKVLVDLGSAPSLERAQALILAGKVRVGDHTVNTAGAPVADPSQVSVAGAQHPFVSRGALKLTKALDVFAIPVEGRICLDIGASTGGFTDVLLRRGAAKVYAIDVGYGQLAWSLRQDPRVVVMERENVRNMAPSRIPDPCDLAVIDVSFISLTAVLPAVGRLLGPPYGKPIVALVKPQFEANKSDIARGGVVRDPAVRLACIDKVCAWARAAGWTVGPWVESPIAGPAGNIEFLLHLGSAPPEF